MRTKISTRNNKRSNKQEKKPNRYVSVLYSCVYVVYLLFFLLLNALTLCLFLLQPHYSFLFFEIFKYVNVHNKGISIFYYQPCRICISLLHYLTVLIVVRCVDTVVVFFLLQCSMYVDFCMKLWLFSNIIYTFSLFFVLHNVIIIASKKKNKFNFCVDVAVIVVNIVLQSRLMAIIMRIRPII